MSGSGPIWEDSEDRKVLAGSGLRLVFIRLADRWNHAIEPNGTGSASTPLARSLETDADRADASSIVSPVYQEIQPHDLGDAPGSPLCVLLTGRHFDHQFSAAVTFAIDPDGSGRVVIDWDVADRCRASVSHLAATYQMPMGSGEIIDADENRISWIPEWLGSGKLEFLAGPPENVALSEAGRTGTRAQAVAKLDGSGFTHRLRYRWRWTPSPSPDRAS